MRRDTGTPEPLGLTVRVDTQRSEIVREFLDTCRSNVLDLRKAMVTVDYATTEDLGFRMRHAGDSLGFGLVTELGSEIEQAARCRDEPSIRDHIRLLQNFLDHVQVVVG